MVESSYSILDGDQCCINVGYVWTIRVIHLPKVKRACVPSQPLDGWINCVMGVQVEEGEVSTIVSKYRLIFHFVHTEYTVRV